MDAPAPTLPSLLLETYHDLNPHSPPPDLSNKQSTEYLTRLTGYSLNSLTSEPSRIADEHAFVGQELTSLCIGEYKSFVAVHQCKEHVKGALDEFDASLEELRRAIPELERECATFVQETSGIQADRRRAQIVLEHQDKLVDLLDIPQLVDTCVRNGYYHEAMELTSHTRQLVERHPDVPLVHSISTQVDSIMQLQLSQLVASLREPVKLPVLVKSIGFLRKMASLQEDELRLAFLESRAQRWRDHVKEHVDKERHDPTRYVRRYVDAFRELQYDTVAQYTAIFLDPTPFRNLSRRNTSGNSTGLDEASRLQALDLIVRYAHHAVSDLLHCITTYIPSITDPSSLASLLTQLGYTALSFSRVGMDFSAHLPEVFEHAVQELTVHGWEGGLQDVLGRLKPAGYTTQRTGSPSGRPDIEAVFVPGFLVSPDRLAQLMRAEPPAYIPPVHARSEAKTVPPLYLTSYPLLATYTNATVTTLNSLRLLAPVALFPTLYAHLLDNLATLGKALLDYANQTTGQAGPASGPPTRKRPEGLRRNTSISNRDQLAERTQARERHGRRILCAVLDAYVNGCVDFLKTALVEGVYAGQFGTVQQLESNKRGLVARSDDHLASVVSQLKDWVSRHAEESTGKGPEQPQGIEEEDVPGGTGATEEADATEQNDVKKSATEEPSQMDDGARVDAPEVEVAEGYSVQPSTLENLEASQGQKDESAKLEASALSPPAEDADTLKKETGPEDAQPPTSPVEDVALAESTATPDAQESSSPKVIEQVLEVGIENPEAPTSVTTDPEDIPVLSAVDQAIPVQITEEVQVPVKDSAEPSLDDATAVPVVSDTSTERHPTETEMAPATGVEDDGVDIVDRLIAAKRAAEAASERKVGDEREDQPQNEGMDQQPELENGSQDAASPDAALPPAALESSERAETAPANAIIDMPTTLPSELAPCDPTQLAQEAEDFTNESEITLETDTVPASTPTDDNNGAEAQPNPHESLIAEPRTADVTGPPVAAPEVLDAGAESTPSGLATPEDEGEDEIETGPHPPAPEAQSYTGNAPGGKSKKKKSKKKGKK